MEGLNSAITEKQQYQREYKYDNVVVMTLSYESYIVSATGADERINGKISTQLYEFTKYAERKLLPQAIEVYKESLANGFPVRPFETVLNYTITFNDKGLLSMYRDYYDYTGGAHGNTVRKSDTYNLYNGKTLPLEAFFHTGEFTTMLLENILLQADRNMQENPGIYFENFPELIIKYFNPENYYLTTEGIAIYYQQYEIAPYSTGIVVFVVPYSELEKLT